VEHAIQQRFARGHLADQALMRQLEGHLDKHMSSGAHFLADVAEVDARRLYIAAGYPSMLDYCVGSLKLSRDAAGRRIQAARTAQRFPWIFEALEDRRLNLTSVNILAAHLTEENAEELLGAAIHKGKDELQMLLAERSSRPATPELNFEAPVDEWHALAHVILSLVSEHTSSPESGSPSASSSRAAKPQEPRMQLRMMVTRTACERLRYAQDLLAHEIPSRDTGKVFEKAIEVLIRKLEKRKFGATDRPRKSKPRNRAKGGRYITSAVREAVWKRDGGQCTFVSESGHRCEARRKIEFDHITEVARGGESTIANLRLRCRTHNQYTAEQTFGAGFMRDKREQRSGRGSSYRSQLSGFIGTEPLRTSKCSIGPLSDPVSPERPMTVPEATSMPVFTLTSERWL
jgi:hypothetical protein